MQIEPNENSVFFNNKKKKMVNTGLDEKTMAGICRWHELVLVADGYDV